jgi:hypothetical protein
MINSDHGDLQIRTFAHSPLASIMKAPCLSFSYTDALALLNRAGTD